MIKGNLILIHSKTAELKQFLLEKIMPCGYVCSMKRQTIIATIIALIISACSGKPKIVFSEVAHDFGKADQESSLTCIFKFTNKGDAVLVIHDIKSG